ncbi:DNA primase large subunit-like [Diorhabda carinulata]|uniref:DNA primase large subunit-like n=1 Tax=Diorhabda carinulata TaxID=1163345 RepID=UPI0025A217B7|nr:DNA primase large subunit-like [Diorhabda carinulata]
MNLNTYRISPVTTCSFLKIEEICKERIQLYAIFEQAKILELEDGTEPWSNFIISNIKHLKLNTYHTLLGYKLHQGLLKSKRIDNTAHWIVGLSYCRTKELQKLFVNWELQWFHLLYINTKKSDRQMFLLKNNLMCKELEYLERISFSDEIINGTDVTKSDYHSTVFYKTKYYEIPEIVAGRKAFLKGGVAVFSENYYICFIKNKLRHEFTMHLNFQNKVYPYLNDRYKYLVHCIPQYIPVLNFGSELDSLGLDNIDQFADHHFPLCMRNLHKTLRTNHHLKYDGRMQLGVFLFWLGLSFEDAMEFWKNEFVKKMPEDLFNRKHTYLFKHQYGLVGRKSPYPPSSCSNILLYTPLPNQHQGCPFKHWSKTTLLETIDQEVPCLKDIEDLVDQRQFQKACTTYFCRSKNVAHLSVENDIIKSPNQYVHESFLVRDILETIFDDDI